jgi:two-component system, cell cycle response regulator DivK
MARLILIVEDDADTRTIYTRALEAHGYDVIAATQGAEGVHLARRHLPDLILMDLRMPVMDGVEAVRYLKADPQTSNIPVCAISAHELGDDAPNPEDALVWDCILTKPIDPAVLVEEITKRIGAGDAAPVR